MEIPEYAEQLLSLGHKLHCHDSLWWIQIKPGFCRTVWRLQSFEPLSAKPALRYSYLGYSHATDEKSANKSPYCVMRRKLKPGEQFSIDGLSANRRSKVRRGLKRARVEVVEDLSPLLPQMMDVAINARERTGAGRPVEYYRKHGLQWQNDLRKLSQFKDNYFLVGFIDNRVAAYFHCLVVERSMSITAAKSHSSFLSEYPNDALVFTAMDLAFNHWGCDDILYGDYASGDVKLNEFKEGYGFAVDRIPQYENLSFGGSLIKRIFALKSS